MLLQSGKPGISQEAKKILDDFPATREEMFDYDCVVAFDPNWQALSAAQVDLLEKWVGEQGGGLIVVAGPVYAGKGVGGWTQDPAMTPIRNLYPVEFPSRLAALENNTYASKEPWPLDFTREGLEADFLWLGDTATASRQAWAGFPGVYSYCPVRGPKPGATVFARFSDPRTAQGGQQPVYFAGQFYGSGSVFYMGSGEMWRLRARRRNLLRAVLHQADPPRVAGPAAARLQPRRAAGRAGSLHAGQHGRGSGPTDQRPARTARRAQRHPAGDPARRRGADASRCGPIRAAPGAYLGQFPALQEGTYRLELPVPESDNERLTRRIQVKVPDLERENPRRNDALLSAIAKNTGGKYYVGIQQRDRRRQARRPGRSN